MTCPDNLKSSDSPRSLWRCLSAQLTLNNKARGKRKEQEGSGGGDGRQIWQRRVHGWLIFPWPKGQGLLLRYWVGQVYEVGVATEFLLFTFLSGNSVDTTSMAYAVACVFHIFLK